MEGNENHLEVPETSLSPNENVWTELTENIDPNRPSPYHGIDIYLEALQFITERLPRNN